MVLSVIWILAGGFLGAKLADRLGLPPLLGMIGVGIFLGVSGIQAIGPELLAYSDQLRSLAVMIILMKAGLGLDWQIAERWSLLAQYDAHAGVIDSDLDALGATPAGMLSAGIRWRPSSQWSIDASFIEDVVVSSAPDVTFQATLRWTPN